MDFHFFHKKSISVLMAGIVAFSSVHLSGDIVSAEGISLVETTSASIEMV